MDIRMDAVVGLRPTICNSMILFTVDQQMRSNDLHVMNFLCADHFPHGDLEKIVRPMELFQLMIKKGKINPDTGDVQYLAELLYFVHRLDLIKKLGYSPQEVRGHINMHKNHLVPAYRILLVNLYDDLVQREVDTIKFFMGSIIGRKAAESAKDALELFREMEQKGALGHEDVNELERIFCQIERGDLAELISQYKKDYLPMPVANEPAPQVQTNPPLPNVKQIAKRDYAKKLVVRMSKPFEPPRGSMSAKQNVYGPSGQGEMSQPGSIGAANPPPENPPFTDFSKNLKKASEKSEQAGDTSMETEAGGAGVPSVLDFFNFGDDSGDDDEGNDSDHDGNNTETMPPAVVNAIMEEGSPPEVNVAYNPQVDAEIQRQLQKKELELQELSQKVQKYEEEKMQLQMEQALPIHDSYEMCRNPRGMCVIINNEQFEGCADPESREPNLKDRRGTDVDAGKLKDTFTALHFDVVLYKNLTHLEMMQLLMHFAMNVNHKNYDCFVCCILTHGQIGQVFGVNGIPVKITDLTGCFRPIACPTLKGKPKLFFLQACQGIDRQRIVPLDIETDEPAAPSMVQETIPNEADFLIGYATVPGFVSYRSQSKGSWYISKLTEHLNSFGRRYDILSILTLVNKDIASSQANLKNEPHPYGQVPAPLHTLRKKVIFKEPTVSRVRQTVERV